MESRRSLSDAERIRLLERQVQELSNRLSALEPRRGRAVSERVKHALERRRAARWSLQGEQWTGRVGLFLLFLGLVFLFRYSVEQGWITPPVRVLFGVALGAVLLAGGVRASRARPSYGAILLAGAIAAFYASGWAASYLYSLLPRPVAFGWMAGVTALALALARRHDQAALASLGAFGGFATPFLLRPDSATVLELVIYTSLVVLWTTALYLERGWRSVSWTTTIGALGVLAVGVERPRVRSSGSFRRRSWSPGRPARSFPSSAERQHPPPGIRSRTPSCPTRSNFACSGRAGARPRSQSRPGHGRSRTARRASSSSSRPRSTVRSPGWVRERQTSSPERPRRLQPPLPRRAASCSWVTVRPAGMS